ncbi:piggyBac transposable element-derived protein 4 [Trichonephila clavipes]|nr:piggyBac transposable element-derived protein 4 [Trichonephila clavipes]
MAGMSEFDPSTTKDPPSKQFSDFLTKCLVKDPQKRASAKDLLEHPFITSAVDSRPLRELIQEHKAEVVEEVTEEDDDHEIPSRLSSSHMSVNSLATADSASNLSDVSDTSGSKTDGISLKSSTQQNSDITDASTPIPKPQNTKPAAPKVPELDKSLLQRHKSKEDVSNISKENLKKAQSTPSLLDNQPPVTNRKPAAPVPPKDNVRNRPYSCIDSVNKTNSNIPESKVIVISNFANEKNSSSTDDDNLSSGKWKDTRDEEHNQNVASNCDESDHDSINLQSVRQWCKIDMKNIPPPPSPVPFRGNPGITVNIANNAILLLQGVIKKPEQEHYWSKRQTLSTPIFAKVIGRNRFLLLMKFFHFTNNEEFDKDRHPWPKLNKIYELMEHLQRKFRKVYIPRKNLSLDESLMKFKGRLKWKMYIAKKRARFGLKFFVLCEVESGYISDFLIYIGEGTVYNPKYSQYPVSTKIVLHLMDRFLGKGYCVTIDNFYMSPQLADILVTEKTDTYGTVNKTRKDLPVNFSKEKVPNGEIVAYQRGKVMALKWQDKKSVCLMSTIHDASSYLMTCKSKKTVMKPVVVCDYNNTMGGVDLCDQEMS